MAAVVPPMIDAGNGGSIINHQLGSRNQGRSRRRTLLREQVRLVGLANSLAVELGDLAIKVKAVDVGGWSAAPDLISDSVI